MSKIKLLLELQKKHVILEIAPIPNNVKLSIHKNFIVFSGIKQQANTDNIIRNRSCSPSMIIHES